jgi:hypothetical protein
MSDVTTSQTAVADGTGKRISTKYSSSLRLFPLAFFGFLALLSVVLLRNGALTNAPGFLLFLGLMSAFGFFFWKTQLQDLMDEVYDCGNYLVVRKRGEEDTILLSNIIGANFSVNRDRTGARITLALAAPCKFGDQIRFAPQPAIYMGPAPEKLARDLALRAGQARKGMPSGPAASD